MTLALLRLDRVVVNVDTAEDLALGTEDRHLATRARTTGRQLLPKDPYRKIALAIVDEHDLLDAFSTRDKRHPVWEQIASLEGRTERLQGRLPYRELAARLSRRGDAGQSAVLWLQDFDDDGPVDLGRPGHDYREELEAQMPSLRRLAAETGAAIVLGHLGYDLDVREGWWPIAEHADTTFHSAWDVERPGSEDFWMVFDGTTERGLIPGKAAFSDWRYKLIKLRDAERAAQLNPSGGV
ncbi:hypothetical protein OJ997_05505 [Solirubrobacter phytolaccae]|uniref:Uncharacterized protein n=1 Tax=Solirubrobacter phytolaccae TaxID=1404360 RepID=A0A9X3N4L2_9ACTN|nr:hypothetical protein [Solirubrobacter phytolaccae]MDA0179740.1 hypothetical protein [Solirubrobacter phytolaccae]